MQADVADNRASLLRELAASVNAAPGPEAYFALVADAAAHELPWFLAAVLRLGTSDLARPGIHSAALVELVRRAPGAGGDLRTLFRDQVDAVTALPEARRELLARWPAFAADTELRDTILAAVPAVDQWASGVVEATPGRYSDRSAPGYVIGAPRVEDCRRPDRETVWEVNDQVFPEARGGEKILRVVFADPVVAPTVTVIETGRSLGGVKRLMLFGPDGLRTEYTVDRPYGVSTCPNASDFPLHAHPAPVTGVAVVVDGNWGRDTEGRLFEGPAIDAVRLTGLPMATGRE